MAVRHQAHPESPLIGICDLALDALKPFDPRAAAKVNVGIGHTVHIIAESAPVCLVILLDNSEIILLADLVEQRYN